MKADILEALKELDIVVTEYADADGVESMLAHNGRLNEIIESKVDIYYYDRRAWAVENWEWVEEAIDAGHVDTSNIDYHDAIEAGQYLFWSEKARWSIDIIFEEAVQ